MMLARQSLKMMELKMISVISWMILFGAGILPIQSEILTLAGVSIVAELAFELFIVIIVVEYKKYKINPKKF